MTRIFSKSNAVRGGIGVALVAVTVALYSRTVRHDFINFDDDLYVTAQPNVQAGLTWEGVRWAFTNVAASNWHPVTWLSHMLDYELFGDKAGGHHAVSVGLHAINSALLFLLLIRFTGLLWPSAFAAALFAFHPLHVESVAWIAERKDVLCTLFFLLTLWAYARFTERPAVGRYLFVSVLFVLGFMAKGMVLTLPFVLLLIDHWPLCRYPALGAKRLVWEKAPLFVLSAAGVGVAYFAQRASGAVTPLEGIPLGVRLAYAPIAYVTYLGKTFYPIDLAVYYPHPGRSVSIAYGALAALFLLTVTAIALWLRRSRPYLPVGWFWFLGTLVPVIGVVQLGTQAIADRYTYIPHIGLFIAVTWGLRDLVDAKPVFRRVIAPTCAAILVALSTLSWFQIGTWRNSITLAEHALAVTKDNSKMRNNLGTALYEEGRWQESAEHFERAVKISPGNIEARNNYGAVLLRAGQPKQAEEHFRAVLRAHPDDAVTRLNLAVALLQQGNVEAALQQAQRILETNPDHENAHRFIQQFGRADSR